jgi:hypothetical protein
MPRRSEIRSQRPLRRDSDVYTPPLAQGIGLQSCVSNVVDKYRRTHLFDPIRQLRVAVKTDSALLHVIAYLIRMTVPGAQGVLTLLFEIRWGTGSGDLRELAFVKL